MSQAPQPLGSPVARREGRDKVTGAACYAAEHTPPGCLHAWPVPATVVRGRIPAIHTGEALALPGVHTVLTHENAPRLRQPDDPALAVLQDDRVPHRGRQVALVVAETFEAARAGAEAVRIEYERAGHDVRLTEDHPGLYTPQTVNGGYPAVRERGDFDRAIAVSPVQIDVTYTLGPLHNHPMEPHASTAHWADDGQLTVCDSSQGTGTVRDTLATVFGLRPDQVTAVSEHVGGGFGSKGTARPQTVLAAMAARHTGRPVKLALPRRQLPAVVGHHAPTVQRIRLGAEFDGTLTSLAHARTGEVRTRRMLGVFAAGRILNSRTARSQFIGGMIMGLGMALTEGSTIDPVFGDFTQNDLASYHVPVCADVPQIEARWIDEDDPHLNPMGSKGIGEIGIVGAAAALANAVRHATGARVRSLPLTPDKLLPYLP
ncbi:molybdopterin cofactor-binding domain-containing protein [Streptomyces sp. 900116325]